MSECSERGRHRRARDLLNGKIGAGRAERGAARDEIGAMLRDEARTGEEERRKQTERQTDRWFNSGIIKDVNEQCLTTNEGWETVLADR